MEEEWYMHDARTAITGMQLEDIMIDDCKILCDTSCGHLRPLIHPTLCKEVFSILHGLSHPDAKATKKLISRDYVWHKMKRDITMWCKHCEQCHRCKIHRHTKAAVSKIPVPEKAFKHVHVDIVSPLPHCREYTSHCD